jgi:ribosome-associated heat shock protein Hsp15
MDKWLWSVRLYKTRSLAAEACVAGKVKIEGQAVKPARSVKVGEMVTAVSGEITRTVKVLALLERRIGAKLVPQYLEDLTPASEYNKARLPNLQPVALRPKGTGRPTKRERRDLENLWIDLNQE